MAETSGIERRLAPKEIPPPQIEEFPIVSHAFFSQKLAGKLFIGMGAFFYGFNTVLHYAFFSEVPFDTFNLFFPTIFVGQGVLMHYGYGRVQSKLKESLGGLKEQGEFKGWFHWASRKYYAAHKEQILNNVEHYLLKNVSHVSKNPNYPYIYGRSMAKIIEANARENNGETCLDVIVFSVFGSKRAKKCGEGLLARLGQA